MGRNVFALAVILALGVAGVLGSTLVLSQEPDGATPEPSPTATIPAGPGIPGLPEGVSGRLTYFSQGNFVTVELPSGAEVAREPVPGASDAVESPDGAWTARPNCGETTCDLTISGADGVEATLHVAGWIDGIEWSADSETLAYATVLVDATGDAIATELNVIDPDAPDAPHALLRLTGPFRLPFVWDAHGDLIVSNNEGAETRIERIDVNGDAETIATVETSIAYFYPSPDGSTVAFTQNGASGWHLAALYVESGVVTDYGAMGSDPAGTAPPIVQPEAKGPMYIAWSPDGRRLAFGGGNEPPYTMTIVDLESGASVWTQFAEGYPGEIKWSPDGTQVAVSTYDVDRTRHEVYIVDPATGVARHVSSGCVIVWSPDGRFLAQHIDKEPGFAIVDIATGQYAHVTNEHYDTPISWEE